MNFTELGSTPFFSSAARIVTSPMLLSVLTATVLPARPLTSRIGLFAGTSTWQASFLPGAMPTPGVMACSGTPLLLAMMSETLLEKPNWLLLLTTAGTIAAPPAASCGSTLSFCALKKPFWTPRYSGATSVIGIRPTFTVVTPSASLLPAEVPPEPQPAARPTASAATTTRSRRRRIVLIMAHSSEWSGVCRHLNPNDYHQYAGKVNGVRREGPPDNVQSL